jgi:hypothetical protein
VPVTCTGVKLGPWLLRKEDNLWVFEDRLLDRMFGRKKEQTMGNWWNIRNEKLHNFYTSPSIRPAIAIKSRRMACMGTVALTSGMTNSYKI